MLPIFSKPAAAPGTPPGSPMTPRPPREHDAATKCRIEKFTKYRKACAEEEKKAKGSCNLVKKCAKHGVGSELWPVEVWELSDEKFMAVNEKFVDPANPKMKAVVSGKQCMRETMKEDAKLQKEVETDCGPLEKKKSVRNSKKPAASPSSPAAAPRAPSKKPDAAIVAKPLSKKGVAAPVAVKPPSKKPVVKAASVKK